jgi:hypothetical protein
MPENITWRPVIIWSVFVKLDPHPSIKLFTYYLPLFSYFEVLLDFFDQDLPGVINDEELSEFLNLKELDERPYMFQAVSAYDG